MPLLHFLNPPPHPFWEFVSDMENHPMFAQDRQPHEGPSREAPADQTAGRSNPEQANVEDPPEVDPATVRPQQNPNCRARERHHRRHGSSSDEEGARERRRRGECGGARGWGRHGPRGFGGPHFPPPPAQAGAFGPGFPFTGPHPPPPPGLGPHHHHHHPGGFWAGPRGRGGFGPRGDHMHGRHRPHHPLFPFGPGRGPRGHSPPVGGPGGFNLGEFLNNLGERIGMDLSGAAQNLGLDRFMPNTGSTDADFEPKVDIFDLTENYVIHLSLPGAKKSDIGVDWDGEHSALRVAGVVHRPDVDEAMLERLVVDGRKRETGVFEKMIRLGTRRDPAAVDVSHITAKMRDGVLVVTVPKSERVNEKREVPIAKSESVSPVRRDGQDVSNEKDMLLFDADADHHMTDTDKNAQTADDADGEIQMIDRSTFEQSTQPKGKQAEAEAEQKMNSRASSATVEEEKEEEEKEKEQEQEQEQLPAYTNPAVERHDHSDWENFDTDGESDEDGEGEFVKINVE